MGNTERSRACAPALPCICLLAVALCGGCAATMAPSGWLGTAYDAANSGYGGWVVVNYNSPQPATDPPAFGEYVSTAEISVLKWSDSAMVPDFTIPPRSAFRLYSQYGRWYQVEWRRWRGWIARDDWRNMRAMTAAGELIAVAGDTLFVLTGSQLHAITAGSIRDAQVSILSPNAEFLGAWMAIGTLTSISHGWYMIFTIPAWLIVGTISTAGQTWQGKLFYPSEGPLSAFSIYARFPQGLPPEAKDAGMMMKGAVR
jgi:hypothetical protein